jgi:hypothetical protein
MPTPTRISIHHSLRDFYSHIPRTYVVEVQFSHVATAKQRAELDVDQLCDVSIGGARLLLVLLFGCFRFD